MVHNETTIKQNFAYSHLRSMAIKKSPWHMAMVIDVMVWIDTTMRRDKLLMESKPSSVDKDLLRRSYIYDQTIQKNAQICFLSKPSFTITKMNNMNNVRAVPLNDLC